MPNKHTPGPWPLDTHNEKAFVKIGKQFFYFDNANDARLIAAAPKMLKALQGLDKYFDSFADIEGSEITGAYLSFEGREAIDFARQAMEEAIKI